MQKFPVYVLVVSSKFTARSATIKMLNLTGIFEISHSNFAGSLFAAVNRQPGVVGGGEQAKNVNCTRARGVRWQRAPIYG